MATWHGAESGGWEIRQEWGAEMYGDQFKLAWRSDHT